MLEDGTHQIKYYRTVLCLIAAELAVPTEMQQNPEIGNPKWCFFFLLKKQFMNE